MSSSCSEDDAVKQVEPDFIWDVKSELALFQFLLYHKPAGINKHFNVALTAEHLSEELGRPVPSAAIWQRLRSLYDLKAVDDIEEAIPFSLEIKDFTLPRQDFETLILEKQREWRHDKSRSRYFSSGGTPSTPKSEGSESRSSPVVSDDDDEIDSDVITDEEEDFDNMDLESIKSDQKDGDQILCDQAKEESQTKEEEDEDDGEAADDLDSDTEKEAEKEKLINEARDEFEKKLKFRQKEEDKVRSTPKSAPRAEPKTPTLDIPKRHMTRSTPTSTPSSTPNKRRK